MALKRDPLLVNRHPPNAIFSNIALFALKIIDLYYAKSESFLLTSSCELRLEETTLSE